MTATDADDDSEETGDASTGVSGSAETGDGAEPEYPEVPDWEDEYIDRVSDRIMFNYDLEKDVHVHGEPFTLEGELRIESHKQFFHPMITYGHQRAYEYLFVRERGPVRVADLERFADLGNTLADERVDADEEHYATDFTFVAVTDDITDEVRSYVESFSERTLLRYGYHGHYEIHLAVVDPDAEELVVSDNADITEALRVWAPIEPDLGLVERLKRRLLG